MRLDAAGKRYGLRQPWVIQDVTLEIPAAQTAALWAANQVTQLATGTRS